MSRMAARIGSPIALFLLLIVSVLAKVLVLLGCIGLWCVEWVAAHILAFENPE